jgi:hypothetical protein
MEEEDRRILVEDVDDDPDEIHPSDTRGESPGGDSSGLSVGFRPCDANCLSIVHLASLVAAIGNPNI